MEGNMTINIKSAQLKEDLDDGEVFGGKMDPYCKIEYSDKVKKTAAINDAGLNPIWNDEFVIRVKSDE